MSADCGPQWVEQLEQLLRAAVPSAEIQSWLDQQAEPAEAFFRRLSVGVWNREPDLWWRWLSVSLPRWNIIPEWHLSPWPLMPAEPARILWEQLADCQLNWGQPWCQLFVSLQRSLGYDLAQAWPLFMRLLNQGLPSPEQFLQQQPIEQLLALVPDDDLRCWSPELIAHLYRQGAWDFTRALAQYQQLSPQLSQHSSDAFLEALTPTQLLYLLERFPERWMALLWAQGALYEQEAAGVDWQPWMGVLNQQVRSAISILPRTVAVYRAVWPHAEAELRIQIMLQQPDLLKQSDANVLAQWLEWYAQWREELTPELLAILQQCLEYGGEYQYYRLPYPAAVVRALWAQRLGWPELELALVQHVWNTCATCAELHDVLLEMSSIHLSHLSQQKVGVLNKLIPQLTEPLLRELLPYLTSRLGSKTLDASLQQRLSAWPLTLLDELGWMQAHKSAPLGVCAEVVLQHSGDTQPYAERLLANHALPTAQRAKLQQQFPLVSAAATPAAIHAKPSPQVLKLYQPQFNQWLAPLDEHEILQLLSVTLSLDQESLLPNVHHSLLRASVAGRALFARHLLELWLAEQGDPKWRWVTRFLPEHSDEGVVSRLMEAVRAWSKPRKARCIEALRLLGRIGGVYALSQLQTVMNGKHSPAVRAAAEAVLKQAAKERQLSLAQLCERLVPDFGLGAGITLTCGERHYQVCLQPDLSLALRTAQGKLQRSWPAQRVDDDAVQWKAAQKCFRELQKGIKTVLTQQQQRLQRALESGQRWTFTDWQEQFIQHPLLSRLAQGLIWLAWDSDGQRSISLRIAEDLTLVNVEDDPVTLTAEMSLSLWHPVRALEGEVQAWQDYCADYQLTLVVDAFQQPTWCLQTGDLDAHGRIVRAAGVSVTQSAAQRLAQRYAYRPEGSSDNACIGYHICELPAMQLQLIWQHSGWSVFFDPNSQLMFNGIEVRWQDNSILDLAQQPVELQATLLEQCEQWRNAS